MRVAFLLPVNGLSGGLFTVYEYARRLTIAGDEAVIFFQDEKSSTQISTYPGMEKVSTALLRSCPSFGTFDIAVATWWETAFSVERISARSYAYFVQGEEGDFYDAPFRTHRLLVDATIRSGLNCLTVSERMKSVIQSRHGVDATVVPNAVDHERFSRAVPSLPPSGRVRVLIEGAGGIPNKQIEQAFEVTRLARKQVDFELVYIASDAVKHPSWFCDHYFQRVPHAEMPGIYKSCQILLKLSRLESFCLPILEAFACGSTAVVGAFAGHDEYIRNDQNALVVNLGDIDEAKAALVRLIEDSPLRERLSLNAFETSRKFDWDRSTQTLRQELSDLLKRPKRELSLLAWARPAYEDYRVLKQAFEAEGKKTAEICSSPSYRIGRSITWMYRVFKAGAR